MVTKTKAKQATVQANLIQEVVETLADLKEKIKELSALEDQYDKQRKFLLNLIPDKVPKDQPFVFEGIEHNVEFSPQSEKRKVTDMKRLAELIGIDVFFDICTVPLKEVDKYLTELEAEQVVETNRTGARVMKVVDK
jgi:hypothetical protein